MTQIILVDVDGTLALRGNRSPYDFTRVEDDAPNLPVIAVVRALHDRGFRIVALSGREESCMMQTAAWILQHLGFAPDLYMRARGDHRPDHTVKKELLEGIVKDGDEVFLALDDRDQCVNLWRSLGIVTFQVAEGNF